MGSFTEDPWREELKFAFSLSKKEYFIALWLSPGDSFLIRSRGREFMHPDFPIITVKPTQDVQGREANVLFPELAACQQLKILLGSSIKHSAPKQLCLEGAYSIREKIGKKCEDRCFVSDKAFGLADGVSAWRMQGIDSGLFAEEFLGLCKAIIQDVFTENSTASSTPQSSSDESHQLSISLKEIAKIALRQTKNKGSSTFLLGFISDNRLRVCNLGDCCLIVIRFYDGVPEIYLRTHVQQHDFNTPYQICNGTEEENEKVIKDSPEVAEEYEIHLEDGDIIIAGSDGLWDNLYPDEILECVKRNRNNMKKLASSISELAFHKSISHMTTPFEEMVTNYYGAGQWKGGKPDDIAVIAVVIRQTKH